MWLHVYSCCRIGSISIVIAFDLFLWQDDETIHVIHILQNNIQSVKTTSLPWIADIFISLSALSLQAYLRFYLRCFKNVQKSNEIITNKLICFLIVSYLSDFVTPLPKDSQSFIVPMSILCVSAPTIILLDHSGFYNFCLDRHPLVKRTISYLKHSFFQCYSKIVDLYVKSNKIKPYDVIV